MTRLTINFLFVILLVFFINIYSVIKSHIIEITLVVF
jgi:hypothetical protein